MVSKPPYDQMAPQLSQFYVPSQPSTLLKENLKGTLKESLKGTLKENLKGKLKGKLVGESDWKLSRGISKVWPGESG